MVKLGVYWKHGLSKHPLYHMWNGMLQRCENPRDAGYPNYGARGITVCDRWHDLRLFIEDIDRLLGERPARHSLDRYPDNDGNYEPGNVRWASPSEQTRNSRKCLQTDLMFWDGTVHQDDSSETLWRPVPGYEGWYEASRCSGIYSLARPGTAGGLLRIQLNSAGHEVVRLSRYGRVRTVTVRSIVRRTFPDNAA